VDPKGLSVFPVTCRRRLIRGILLLCILTIFIAADISLAGEVTVISDIKEWHHPVKDILIAFAKSSFLLSPLPPAGGEGQGEGGRKKLLATSIVSTKLLFIKVNCIID